jgi:excisionase family DNA binding protein
MESARNEIQLLRVDDAARRLGISRSKVYELIQSQTLRSVHIGRSVRISSKALDEFILALEDEGPKDAAWPNWLSPILSLTVRMKGRPTLGLQLHYGRDGQQVNWSIQRAAVKRERTSDGDE